jgi:tetratricopeptide (TPR) repeat protein
MVFDPIDRQRLVALYEQRLAADPGSRAFLPLAELYRREARHQDARRVLETGVGRHPAFVSALVALAQVLLDQSEDDRARDVLAQVSQRDPDNLVALRLLAAAAENAADWAGVVQHLERVVRLEPADFEAVARLRAARAKVEAASATAPAPVPAAAAASVVALGPGDTVGGVVTLTLADLYLRQGYTDRARELLVRMAAADPDREDVRERLVRLARSDASPAVPGGMAPRRGLAGERSGERQRLESWLERASED